MCVMFVFFKQKTAYEMRISDWSSDVCSSDLNPKIIEVSRPATANTSIKQWLVPVDPRKKREVLRGLLQSEKVNTAIIFCNRKTAVQIGRASCRERGCQ